ncbi:hypothetical protein SEA_OZZYJ_33 [Streptomyces phage OzzyJ]|uniref:Membrane protein n=1 Tax=Streptomyces phage Werner TaxID=2801898 RepID=A0A7U0GCV1_9CAUD|nr:membrane protein [Streptomyces phage Werner]AVE00414.1 hypothetical protein SEA_OZZYJ_33 [Streptomyces phage OzzyJ]QAY17756.1 hypothetical protein SEA_ASTEN_32 [Streptomyces phage Asten]QFP95199.1 membrane protein [Streptomyces phage Whatever]QQO39647.1 membrane protein [Streptomyces phage Hippo]QQO39954.1 membrane protein [Streptomyces phage Dwayne]QYW07216.1 membrane protein [Streptomyces phage Chucky]QYW07951.1 membrane protein [Streptomyces phage Triste]QZE11100.1 membrane protein [S
MRDRLTALAGVALIVTLIAGSIWVWTSAPCGLWTFSKAGDMPARCLNK